MQDGQEAGRSRRESPKRQGAKVTGSGRRPATKKLRVQFHLGETLIERLGVHASLAHADKSRVVEEVLGAWLGRFGKGRELFGQADLETSGGGDDSPPE